MRYILGKIVCAHEHSVSAKDVCTSERSVAACRKVWSISGASIEENQMLVKKLVFHELGMWDNLHTGIGGVPIPVYHRPDRGFMQI